MFDWLSKLSAFAAEDGYNNEQRQQFTARNLFVAFDVLSLLQAYTRPLLSGSPPPLIDREPS